MTRNEYIQKKLLEPNTYSSGYVAFLDILGFKEICRNKSCEEIKALFDDIQMLKYDYCNYFGALLVPQNVIDNVEIKIISDSVIVTAPDGEDGIVFMLWFCSTLQNKMLSCGVILRGGISFGNYYVHENTVFGPALVEAYEIEEKAVFPRIVLSKEIEHQLANEGFFRKKSVQDYIDNVSSNNHTDSNISLLIKKDFDDLYFVHYFNYLQNIKLANKVHLKQKIKEFIVSSMEEHKNDIKLFEKYYWLNKYFEKSIENNSMNNMVNFQKSEEENNG